MKRSRNFLVVLGFATLSNLVVRVALAPRRVLVSLAVSGLSVSLTLIFVGLMLYRPPAPAAAAYDAAGAMHPLVPAGFTPLASPPPAFAGPAHAYPEPSETGAEPSPTLEAPKPTSTPPPVDLLLERGARNSELSSRGLISILLLGTDERPHEGDLSRTDTMMVAVLDLKAPSLSLISIPRDLWVWIPGYGEAKINTAYFLGQLRGDGPEVARQTVSQLLNLPITDTAVVNFDAFRQLVDLMGGVELYVPEPIDDALFPDDSYGTFHLVIPKGRQQMDGERALQYVRTRHGSSDIARAERQQAVLEAVRRKLLAREQLPHLPRYIASAASAVDSTFSLPDLFFLARFAHSLPRNRIHTHVIQPPLLWDGVTADGQQILVYDPTSLQQTVQNWLTEAAE